MHSSMHKKSFRSIFLISFLLFTQISYNVGDGQNEEESQDKPSACESLSASESDGKAKSSGATTSCPSPSLTSVSDEEQTTTNNPEAGVASTINEVNDCQLFPVSGQGPFYIPNQKIRSNITEGKPGVAVHLTLIVRDVETCLPIPNIPIDLWHSDALGYYSGYLSYYKNGKLSGLSGGHVDPTDSQEFLRGQQYTNQAGQVTFHTIFPGWYTGRTNHFHIQLVNSNGDQIPGHIFFTEETTAAVAKEEPYTKNKNTKTLNVQDGAFVHRGGESTTIKFNGNPKSGLVGTMVLGIRN